MQKKYKIINIFHNGRKGLRGTEVDNPKYKGVIGKHCYIDFLEEVKQFKRLSIKLLDSYVYDQWTTSEAFELSIDKDGLVSLETANSIYIFKECYDG